MISGVLKSINKGINKLMKTNNKYSINGKEYVEERLLAEGGFGYVYIVEDPDTGRKYALKKMNIMENSQLLNVKKEIEFWKKVNNHANIVKLIEYEINQSAVFILMEYCSEGSLLEFINNRTEKTINESQALYIIKEIASGIYHMHSQSPPIAHRDIKIENVLKVGNNFKLCDFGSASIDTLDPKKESKTSLLENFSKFEKHTTFMYRPPEMCDPYSKFPIHEKVDVWMLGCILYALLFKLHPFQDAQKLTIINAQYYIPDEAKNYSDKIIDFVRLMLTPNPSNRPSIKEVLSIILNWNNLKSIDLPEETEEIKKKQLRNVKTNKTNLLSADDIYKAQQEILKKQAKQNKYKKRNDDDGDINEMFDDLEFGESEAKTNDVRVKKETREESGLKSRSKSPNLVQNRPFDGFNNNNSSNSGNMNVVKNNSNNNKQGEWLIDFSQGFAENTTGNAGANNNNGFNFDFFEGGVGNSNSSNSTNNKNNVANFNDLGNVFSNSNSTSTNSTNVKPPNSNKNNTDHSDFGEFVFSGNNNKSKSNNNVPQVKSQTNNNSNQGGFNFDNKFGNTNNNNPGMGMNMGMNMNYYPNTNTNNNNNQFHNGFFNNNSNVSYNYSNQHQAKTSSSINQNTRIVANTKVNVNINNNMSNQSNQNTQSKKGEQSIYDFFK